MSTLYIQLFGRLRVWRDNRTVCGFDSRKAQELFCYLILHRDHPHSRETLAELFWGNSPAAQSKRSFRQTLWQLQAALDTEASTDRDVLLVESDWIQINPEADLWCDVVILERASELISKSSGHDIDSLTAQMVQDALQLYKGDLLETWYQDWCLFERERLQNILLNILDKMMSYCEAHYDFDAGLSYGERTLRYDRAHERTHARMMRLHYLRGDRTAALRQYESCVAALEQELDVKPTKSTETLYRQIRADQVSSPSLGSSDIDSAIKAAPVAEILERLRQVESVLIGTHHQLQQDLQALERVLIHSR